MPVGRLRCALGFTLVETIVAIVLLAVGLLGLASAAPSALRLAARGYARTHTATIARSRLELLRIAPCDATAGSELVDGFAVRWGAPTADGGWVTVVVDGRQHRLIRPDSFTAMLSCDR